MSDARTSADSSTTARWVATEPAVERIALDDRSWVDVVRGLVARPDELHADLMRQVRWGHGSVFRYDHLVVEQRLGGSMPRGRRHPGIAEVERWMSWRYRVPLGAPVFARYRDEREGMGFHRDRGLTWLDDTVIAVLSTGQRRPWLIRPDVGRRIDPDDDLADALDLSPAGGDLIVMGGRCQRGFLHAVPRVRERIGERISVQWRWTSRRGEPDTDAKHRHAWRYGS